MSMPCNKGATFSWNIKRKKKTLQEKSKWVCESFVTESFVTDEVTIIY